MASRISFLSNHNRPTIHTASTQHTNHPRPSLSAMLFFLLIHIVRVYAVSPLPTPCALSQSTIHRERIRSNWWCYSV
eukprot:298979-Pyramimonas_sp.AAC.1